MLCLLKSFKFFLAKKKICIQYLFIHENRNFLFLALRVTNPMKSVEVPETQVATFECEVSHFNVPSTWLKNGVEIEMSEKFRIVVQGKLHQLKIMNTSRDDSAEYTFICGNDRVSATLTVNRKIVIQLQFSVCAKSNDHSFGSQMFSGMRCQQQTCLCLCFYSF